MENKINIAELLKDCPKGMELNCTMYDKVSLLSINDEETFPIKAIIEDGSYIAFTKYGQYTDANFAKCVIFPKDKTTWKGFHRPFEDGDILATNDGKFIAIVKKNGSKYYCCCHTNDTYFVIDKSGWFDRFATEEEKQKLFNAIKANGYKWNDETKTLEKLPKFKIGNRIKKKNDTRLITIKDIRDNYYIITISNFFNNGYITDKLSFNNQNEYEIVPNKFNITTLKPFDKVLVRGDVGQKWTHDFFGFIDENKGYPFVCVGHYVIQCIPYKNNEHLLGTTNDCDDFYKTWEK